MNWLIGIPNLDVNLFFGGLGAILVVLYQIDQLIPDIRALLDAPNDTRIPMSRIATGLLLFSLKVVISVAGGSLVAGFLIRPQETYGAIVAGMTWTAAVRARLET